MDEKTFRLKALVDKKSNRILVAESDKDFVNILFSFLTMPMGTIVKLICSQHPQFQLGCLSNLYRSVETLDAEFVKNESYRKMLQNPQNWGIALCNSLKLDDGVPRVLRRLNLNCTCRSYANPSGAPCYCGSSASHVVSSYQAETVRDMFTKGQPRFVISDELEVLPASTAASLKLLSKSGELDGEKEYQDFTIGKKEVLNILMFSLVSKTALTNTLLQHELTEGDFGVGTIGSHGIFGDLFNGTEMICVKLNSSKSNKNVLYAEGSGDFVNLLFSFLTVPLGRIVREIYHGLSTVCIIHLYKSVRNLDARQYLISDEHKEILLTPPVGPGFSFEKGMTSFDEVPLSRSYSGISKSSALLNTTSFAEERRSFREARTIGGFVKGKVMFSISGDLRIDPISPVTYLSALSKSFSLDDIKASDVYIGKKEAFRLLVASVFSQDALNEALHVYASTQNSDQPATSIQSTTIFLSRERKKKANNLFSILCMRMRKLKCAMRM